MKIQMYMQRRSLFKSENQTIDFFNQINEKPEDFELLKMCLHAHSIKSTKRIGHV